MIDVRSDFTTHGLRDARCHAAEQLSWSKTFKSKRTLRIVGQKVQEDIAIVDAAATAGEAGGNSEIPVVLDSNPSVVDAAIPVVVAEGACEVVTGCLVGRLRWKKGGAEGWSCAVTRRL